MKSSIVLFTFVLFVISSCTQPEKSPVEGSWQLVYGKWMDGDSILGEFPGKIKGNDIKMWSKGHFLFAGQFKIDTITMDNYGGGTYKIEGNQYEETVQYHAMKSMVGATIKMLVEIKNDTLFQTWPLGESGQIDKTSVSLEKYVRLD